MEKLSSQTLMLNRATGSVEMGIRPSGGGGSSQTVGRNSSVGAPEKSANQLLFEAVLAGLVVVLINAAMIFAPDCLGGPSPSFSPAWLKSVCQDGPLVRKR